MEKDKTGRPPGRPKGSGKGVPRKKSKAENQSAAAKALFDKLKQRYRESLQKKSDDEHSRD